MHIDGYAIRAHVKRNAIDAHIDGIHIRRASCSMDKMRSSGVIKIVDETVRNPVAYMPTASAPVPVSVAVVNVPAPPCSQSSNRSRRPSIWQW